MSSHKGLEVLERIEDKLYRAWVLQGLLAYAYWLLVLEGYMVLASTSWFLSLGGGGQSLASLAYWLGVGVPGFFLAMRHLRRYYMSLEATAPAKKRPCTRPTLLWPLGFAVAPAAAALFEGLYGRERLVALSVLLAVTLGSWGNVAAEVCLSRHRRSRRVPSLYAALVLSLGVPGLLAAPREVYASTVFAAAVIGLGYTASIIAYALESLHTR